MGGSGQAPHPPGSSGGLSPLSSADSAQELSEQVWGLLLEALQPFMLWELQSGMGDFWEQVCRRPPTPPPPPPAPAPQPLAEISAPRLRCWQVAAYGLSVCQCELLWCCTAARNTSLPFRA